jgi:hypothetical protein
VQSVFYVLLFKPPALGQADLSSQAGLDIFLTVGHQASHDLIKLSVLISKDGVILWSVS